MKCRDTELNGVKIISYDSFKDDRGYFERLYCKEKMANIGVEVDFVQMNHSFNLRKGTFRGLHFQYPPFSEMKIVRCVSGSVLDIVIDLRKSSTTFLQVFKVELSEENSLAIVIPEGCAHGFLTLKDSTHLIYLHSKSYEPGFEGGLNVFDPQLNIQMKESIKVISERDKAFDFLDKRFEGLEYDM